MRYLALAFLLAVSLIVPVEAAMVVNSGRSDYKIVTPGKASQPQKYAAKELQSFLYKISGAKLPIVSERLMESGPAFYIGPCNKVKKAGFLEQLSGLAEDGVYIKSFGNDFALLGQNERGQVYSVYVFLEKFLGVKFLAWDCTVIPKKRNLELSNIDYRYAPPFMYRETLSYDSFPREIATRQRLNGPYAACDKSVGGKIEFFPFVHSFDDLIPPEEYFKDHPEYFGLQGGKRVAGHVHAQLCLTNPDVLRISKEKVLKWIEEHPDVPIFDVSQNDGNGPCECENCMAIVNEEGSQHGPILRFVNAIADEVAKKYPDKWIETLAYAYAMNPPSKTVPRSNVIIRLCHAGCYYHGFEQCGLGANLTSYLDRWSKLTKRVFIWHYATNFAHYLAPNPNLSGLAKDIKYYGSRGLNGLMVQCNYQGHGGELAEMRQYLSAQLMWNPNRDASEILDEFCRGYYGRSAEDVLQFVALMDRVSQDPNIHAFGAWDPQEKISKDFIVSSLVILESARAKAENARIRNRVEKLMLPFWYMQLVYSAKYGVSDDNVRVIWKNAKPVIQRNKIAYVREGEVNMPEWVAAMDRQFTPLPKNVVFDLLQINNATTVDCADWRNSSVVKNGKTLQTVFQHPNKGDSDAIYKIALPKLKSGQKLSFKFGTVITNKSEDGVRFTVLVNGKQHWTLTQTAYLAPAESAPKAAQDNIMPNQNPFADAVIDLTEYAGKQIELTLRINPISNGANDWANWIEPKIILD